MIEALITHLITDPGVTALNGDRVYPDVAPEGLDTSIIITRITSTGERLTTGVMTSRLSIFQIDIRSFTRKTTDDIASQVLSTLDNLSGTIGGKKFDRALFDSDRDDYESDMKRFLNSMTFYIYHY